MAVDTGSRPGGLTALAVLNFIFGGSALVTLFAILANRHLRDEMTRHGPQGVFFLVQVLGLFTAALLIVSGIGYLQLRRLLGKGVGITYGLLDMVRLGIQLAYFPEFFSIIAIAQLLYPLYTLVLLGTTFRSDFINP